jgi:hypothetical protein
MGKIIRINETELISLIGRLLNEVHQMDEVGKEVYQYVRDNPEKRFIMSEEDIINFRDQNEQEVSDKPNGLWYAVGSEWIDWVRNEMPEWETDNVFEIKINDDKILKISTYDDIFEFTKKYGRKDYGFLMINWNKVSQDYSGIEIVPFIRPASRKLNWYYTWDIASGCIWRGDGIKSIKKVKF